MTQYFEDQLLTNLLTACGAWMCAVVASLLAFVIITCHFDYVIDLEAGGYTSYLTVGVFSGVWWRSQTLSWRDLSRAAHFWLLTFAIMTLYHDYIGDFILNGPDQIRSEILASSLFGMAFFFTICWSTWKTECLEMMRRLCESIETAFDD